ncbi:MAG TPA: orotidine-5'-phosphate decarboxylase [Methanomicrobiales archaeon]|nr:orotidine-5'-phosphate decarboxylase [Methanomicrobiales archaeon]
MADLILALDVTDRGSALRIARACAPSIDAIKIGYPLVLSESISIARDLLPLDLPIIADFKVADIPETNELICTQALRAGFSAVIAHAFPGGDALSACIRVAHANGGACYAVAEMSHPGGEEFFHGGVAERLAALAVQCGADGIIAPATRPDRVERLREIVGTREILSPGVGAQGGDPGAIKDLVDGIIVGRSIYGAADPAAAAAEFARRCR